MDGADPGPVSLVRAESVAGWVAAGATVLGLYVAVVLGGGVLLGRTDSPNLALSILATATVAVLSEPVRLRVERRAARRLNRDRRSPYDVLAEFSREVASGGASEAGEAAPPVIARMLVQGTGMEWAQVWVRVADSLRAVATYPPGAAADVPPPTLYDRSPPPGVRTVSVLHAGRVLGVLRMGGREDRPRSAVEDRLLAGLGAQAGMVLQTAQLRAKLSDQAAELTIRAAQLRQARTALVTAQDRERRRLERDIHDGAQQQLVALAINLKVARAQATTDPAAMRATLEEQRFAVAEAIRTLSDLSRGLLPDVLAECGLAAAVTRSTAGNPVPVTVTAPDLPRFSREVEATLYFCALEAVQNATKHARASRIAVRGTWDGRWLCVHVEDDGTGLAPGTEEGTGLTNMRERVASVGGTVQIGAGVSGGTAVRVRVPGQPSPLGEEAE